MPARPPLFSIVTVCLNPGKDLLRTAESVLAQDYTDFEYIIKDGLSADGAQGFSCSDPRVTVVSQADGGIYDAMNQALGLCAGRYVNFLNAGDTFCVSTTLSEVARLLKRQRYPDMAYVDRYNEKLDAVTHYPSSLTAWYLFRRPVCHQALFVKRRALSSIGGFDRSYRILADYDALAKLVLANKATHIHCPLVAVSYKDDGVSAAPENQVRKLSELRRIRQTYLSRTRRLFYNAIWLSTLPGIRTRLVYQNRVHWLRRVLYR